MDITVDGDLILTGDAADNEFVIERLFNGVMQVAGVNTNIIFNNVSAASHSFTMVDPMGIDRDVTIDAGEGSDTVSFFGLDVGRILQATLRGGDDVMVIENAEIASHTSISAGSGNDSVELRSSDISGSTTVLGSDGDDTLYIDSIFVSESFSFDGGNDDDTVDSYFVEEFNAVTPIAIDFLGGAGNDTMNITGSIGGSMLVDGGDGDDTLNNFEPIISGDVIIEGGTGVDDVDVRDGIITGDLYIHVREGVVGVAEPIQILDTQVDGNTSARGSTGNQQVTLTGNTLQRLDVVLGGGDDQVIMSNTTAALSNIKTGSGADLIDFSGNTFSDRLLVDAGGGIDTINTAASDSFSHYVILTGGLNHNDVANLTIQFLAGANIASIETIEFLV